MATTSSKYKLFVVGAAGDLSENIPEGLKLFGSESHWKESMKIINKSTGLVSPLCLFCCPCFVCNMLLGGGLKDHLAREVHM